MAGVAEKETPTPAGESLRLHIGGHQAKPGWKIFNIRPGKNVDFVGNCTDLSMFATGSADSVYASHVIEHLGHRVELPMALAEIRRILRQGGKFYVSVPDLEFLCGLFVRPGLPVEFKIRVVKMIFGMQSNEHDFHKFAFSLDTLAMFLAQAGFTRITRVHDFGLFEDYSRLEVEGKRISINLIVE
jgi:predicted SAM-dependent methyltransferase